MRESTKALKREGAKARKVGVWIIAIALIFGCSSSKKSIKQQNATPLLGSYWELQSIEGERIDTANLITIPYIIFDTASQYRGNFGCNFFFGDYYAGKKKIYMSYMGASKRLCPDMDLEKKFYNALKQEIRYYIIENNTLTLSTKSGVVLLRFVATETGNLREENTEGF
jgi:Heat shock protein